MVLNMQVYKPVDYVHLIGPDPLANTTGGVLAYDQLVATGISCSHFFLLIIFVHGLR